MTKDALLQNLPLGEHRPSSFIYESEIGCGYSKTIRSDRSLNFLKPNKFCNVICIKINFLHRIITQLCEKSDFFDTVQNEMQLAISSRTRGGVFASQQFSILRLFCTRANQVQKNVEKPTKYSCSS